MSPVSRRPSLPVVLGAFAAINCALFLLFIEKTTIHGAVGDALDWIYFYGARPPSCDLFCYLWTPHNEHRLAFTRILVALDLRWFDRIGPSFVVFGLLLVCAMAAMLGREIANSALPLSWRRAALSISILLVAPANIAVLVSWANICGELHTCAFALFSLTLLDDGGKRDRFASYRRLAAIVAACLTAFGVSAGLLIWPVLIWSAWRSRLPWPWTIGMIVAGVLFVGAYSWHLPAQTAPGVFTLSGIAESFDYMIRVLGLPWSRLPLLLWPGRLIGFGMLCIGVFALLRDGLSARPISRLQRIGLGLMLFSLLVAASAPVARLNLDTGVEVPIRYGMFVVPLQAGLLLWSLEYLYEYRAVLQRMVAPWMIVAACVIWLVQQVAVGEYAAATVNIYNNAWARFVAGEWTPDMLDYIYPNREIAEARLAYLREIHFHLGD